MLKSGVWDRVAQRRWSLVALLIICCGTVPAGAVDLPKWEAGVGLAALRLPAYRGAKEVQNYLLPFPYVAFRGERFRIDEEGIRSNLLERRRFRLDFSLAGNVPVKDSDVAVREGMPALDSLGEVGPTFDWSLWKRSYDLGLNDAEIWLRLPMRAVISVGDPLLAHQGWVFSPTLEFVYRRGRERDLQRWALSLGPLYGSRGYHQYFYEVSPDYVTADRDLYQASGGYSGKRITLSMTLTKRRWFFGGFVRYDDLSQAVFADSPLVETRRYFVVGLALSRVFAVSRQRASRRER